MENLTPQTRRSKYLAFGLEVRHGGALVATAQTNNMAKRIAFALNRYREEYREFRKKKD